MHSDETTQELVCWANPVMHHWQTGLGWTDSNLVVDRWKETVLIRTRKGVNERNNELIKNGWIHTEYHQKNFMTVGLKIENQVPRTNFLLFLFRLNYAILRYSWSLTYFWTSHPWFVFGSGLENYKNFSREISFHRKINISYADR